MNQHTSPAYDALRYVERLYRGTRVAVFDALEELGERRGVSWLPSKDWLAQPSERLDKPTGFLPRWGSVEFAPTDYAAPIVFAVARFYSSRRVEPPILVMGVPLAPATEPGEWGAWRFGDDLLAGRCRVQGELPRRLSVVGARHPQAFSEALVFAVRIEDLTDGTRLARWVVDPLERMLDADLEGAEAALASSPAARATPPRAAAPEDDMGPTW